VGLAQLHREILGCTRCVEAGYLQQAAPVLSGYPDNRIMLIGQAPGAVEAVRRLPFQGRSRKVLMGWLMRGGFSSEAQIRRQVYMTSITKCFPGKGSGGGDRRPRPGRGRPVPLISRSAAGIGQARAADPGGRARPRPLPAGRQLDTLVGRLFDLTGREVRSRERVRPLIVPLPHPSGASRWLNAVENRLLLEQALRRLRPLARSLLDAQLVGA